MWSTEDYVFLEGKIPRTPYSDFLASSSRIAVSRRLGISTDENKDLAAINDAKNRIIVCGNVEVVEALIHFWNEGGTLEKEGEILAYDNLTWTMRLSLGHKRKGMTSTWTDALFTLEPSKFSFRTRKKQL